MPRYFFDTSNGETTYSDTEGVVLADHETARRNALDALPDMASDESTDVDHRKLLVVVRDEDGRVIYSASLTLDGRWQ